MPRNSIPPEVGCQIAQALQAGGDQARYCKARYMGEPWNFSEDKIYRVAKKHGFVSGRKARRDKGEIRVTGLTEELVSLGARVTLAGTRRQSGKRLVTTEDMCQQLALNGHKAAQNASVSTWNRLLRDRGLSHADLMAGNPAIEMRSEHPNHVHFVDASVCVQWDLKGGKNMVARDMQKAFYKNKPGYWREVKKVLIRWMLVDHCSHAFWVRYTYASGENGVDLLDFLLDGWGGKPFADRFPFHGVPRILGMDPGAANLSYPVQRLLDRLQVESYVHAPGNSRASGCVEVAHNIWETRFEFELLLKLAEDLESLNDRAKDRMIYLNAVARHSRHGRTRAEKWREITAVQLRVLPPKAHCQALATTKPVERTPNERLRISFESRDFQLWAPALKNRKVTVELSPWNPDDLIVTTLLGEPVPCRLIEKDAHGFDRDSPVFGAEQYQRHPDTPAEKMRRDLEADEYRIEGFEPKPTGHLAPAVHFLPVRGTEILLADVPKAPPIRAGEIPGKLRRDLGLERITPPQRLRIEQWIEGRDLISHEQYREIVGRAAEEFKVRLYPAMKRSPLKAAAN